jgi:glycosyltransferase involved in cell wall biosynthesis
LAGLRRAGVYRGGLAVAFQSWSPRQEAALFRLALIRELDIAVVLSAALRDHFLALGAEPERVRFVPFGIDHRFFLPRGPATAGTYALTLGEIRNRDYASLLRAVDGLPFELRVLAQGYTHAREKRTGLVAERPANVTVLPRLPLVEVRELYAGARFVVLPVHDLLHPAGITAALEAMSMARAVIATRSRGLADYLVDDENCLLVEPGDVAGLRDAMRRLVADPALARRLGESGRQYVEAGANQARYVEDLAALVSSAWPPAGRSG